MNKREGNFVSLLEQKVYKPLQWHADAKTSNNCEGYSLEAVIPDPSWENGVAFSPSRVVSGEWNFTDSEISVVEAEIKVSWPGVVSETSTVRARFEEPANCVTPTPEPSATPTATNTATETATSVPTLTYTPTGTMTATFTPSATATESATPTSTATATQTETATVTPTGTYVSPTPSRTATATSTTPATATPEASATPGQPNTPEKPVEPSETPKPIDTPVATPVPAGVGMVTVDSHFVEGSKTDEYTVNSVVLGLGAAALLTVGVTGLMAYLNRRK